MKALILVDFENEWTDPKSENYVGDITGVISKVNKLTDWARDNKFRIIFTIHEELGSEKEFAPGSENTQLIKSVHKKDTDIVIRKNKISPFYKTGLEDHLREIEEIYVAGILTNLYSRNSGQCNHCCSVYTHLISFFAPSEL